MDADVVRACVGECVTVRDEFLPDRRERLRRARPLRTVLCPVVDDEAEHHSEDDEK